MISSDNPRGYIELAHTADWAVKIWAMDYFDLLRIAAEAMYSLQMVEIDRREPGIPIEFLVQDEDEEITLVGFLSELLYHQDTHFIALDNFIIEMQQAGIRVCAVWFPIIRIEKEIKAVTYSGLKVQHFPQGIEAIVVFDV